MIIWHQVKRDELFDIYRDSLIHETMECRAVLLTMKERVVVLLSQWEGHPTLIEILKVIERILNFSVTFPIMKFVTGLEILLQKANVSTNFRKRF